MKKLISVLIVSLLVFSLSFAAFAEDRQPAVVDDAGLLSGSEIVTLSEKLDTIRDTYNVDVAFVSSDYFYSSAGIVASADDYFDYEGYGFGENRDGIIFYISMDTREYAYSTRGYAITAFTDYGLEYMDNKVKPYLKEGDYYAAVDMYADTCSELLEIAESGTPYDVNTNEDYGGYDDYDEYYSGDSYEYDDYDNFFEYLYYSSSLYTEQILLTYGLLIGGAVILAFILTKRKSRQMKTAVKNDMANNYIKEGSMVLTQSEDIFLYSNVTRTAKPKDTDGPSHSGGSSTHTSSSGATHGGRSGSF